MDLDNIAVGANASIFRKVDPTSIVKIFYPSSVEEIKQAIAFARARNLKITTKGGGSGLSGCCTGGNEKRIIISNLRLKKVLEIDTTKGIARVQPGITPDELNKILPKGYRFRVAPSSRDTATLSGMISTDAGGNDAWIHGTMRDNTRSTELITATGDVLKITSDGVTCPANEKLAAELNALGFDLHDVASSHGTLGVISSLEVRISPGREAALQHGLLEFNNHNECGEAISSIIDKKLTVYYGETIIKGMETVRKKFRYKDPLIIVDIAESDVDAISNIGNYKKLGSEESEHLKQLRLDLPKMNPEHGVQSAVFEGYGFSGAILPHLGDKLDLLDEILVSSDLKPFLRYGHAPSVWYTGRNSRQEGLIMHARDIRPDMDGTTTYKIILEIIDFCKREGITPKPEHKYPYADSGKIGRLEELRKVLGESFNPFIVSSSVEDMSKLVF
ncbi:MAG: FAD-binding oxidoreductase [Candidatus Odinarchaeota archaeon]